MVKIAIIKENNVDFSLLTYEDIIGQQFELLIKENVEIQEIDNTNNETMMKNIIHYLNFDPEKICRTYKFHENENYIFYILYIAIEKDDECNNILGRYITENHEPITGNCILLKTSKNENYDITFEDIKFIFCSRFYHKAVIITPSNEIKETTYFLNPIENTEMTENNCRCMHIEFLNRIICVFLELRPSNDKFNKYGTLLCKRLKVHGNIIVSLMINYPAQEIIDITPELFKKILVVRSNTSTDDVSGLSNEVLETTFYDVLKKYNDKFKYQINETIPDDVINNVSLNSTLYV
jgi:hypothetical protein